MALTNATSALIAILVCVAVIAVLCSNVHTMSANSTDKLASAAFLLSVRMDFEERAECRGRTVKEGHE